MLVGGSDLGTYYDFAQGVGRYYKYKYMWFAFASWTATSWITCEELANRKLVRAHDDNFSGSAINKYIQQGYTAKKYILENKDKINYVCGDSPETLAKRILAGGGNTDDDSEGSSQPSTIKEALKKLMSYYDGDIECRVEGNQVFINKIGNPSETSLIIAEGRNIVDDSVSIKDYYPTTVNFLTVHWQGGEDIVYRDESLIARFGEIPLEMDAVKKVTTVTEETTTETTTDEETGEETEETTTETKTETTEVPVETLEEAETFARIEWAKIRRDDGYSLDLKVVPDATYRIGEWVYVYIPTYDVDKHMYITKQSVTHSADPNAEIGLTLVDYPPSFGEFVEESSEEEEDEELDEETDEEVEE